MDTDEKKVELLKEEDFVAFVGDISEPKEITRIKSEGEPEAFFVLSNSSEVNKKAAKNIKEKLPQTCLIVRVIEPGDKEDLEELGVDVALSIRNIVSRAAIESLDRVKAQSKAKELMAVIEAINKKGKLGIVVHDSPDSDAIASALALKRIAKNVDVPADILYRGEIGHHVNRAFVNILGIEMRQIEGEEELKEYDKLALMDASVPGANNLLPPPPEGNVDIIIDHHVANNKENVHADFFDVRTDNGATSTIMTRYLQELGIPVDKILATALLQGIRTDTSGFKRETHPSDFSAAAFLHVKADKELLEQIETPPMSTEMLNVIGNAIVHKKIKGSYLITNVGAVVNRDAIPQAADYLLNLEGITTAIVIGLCEDTICVSGRSKDIRVNIGDAFAHAFEEMGSAGGHATMAAAQLPLGIFSGIKDKDTLIQLAEDAVTKRFMSVMKEEKSE
uniref:Manganese-dependent inorganic pyrophosphatase n=1 Tax=Candidatus Methanophagaceae archaeon ANME-1 ERB6 TaxID=2759912 RepID=A0A7G9YY01_9EURY|nr:manganese-dependent inorganic pyrophosphatase [Methanosarcinales archaeon ANME-1 ERB6]